MRPRSLRLGRIDAFGARSHSCAGPNVVFAAVLAAAVSSGCWLGRIPGPGPAPAPRRLTLLATNDFHGAFHERAVPGGQASGGVAALAGAIEEVRARVGRDRVLLVDAGDLFQGSPLVNETRGAAAVEFYSRLGYDAVAVGNHEFDYGGAAGLLAAARRAAFPFLTANVEDGAGRPLAGIGVLPSIVVERAGVSIGLLGLTTGETPVATHPRNFEGNRVVPVAEAAAREAARLRGRGAELVIALAHVSGSCGETGPEGHPEQVPGSCTLPDSELRRLVELPPGTLDVVVAGHDHAVIAHWIGEVAVLQQGAHGAFLGRIDLAVGPKGLDRASSVLHAPRPLVHGPSEGSCDAPGPPPPGAPAPGSAADGALRWLASREAALGLDPCRPVGCLSGPAAADRTAQGGAGSVVARAMLRALPGDLALQNGGGVRTSLAAGTVRAGDLYRLLPFDNRVVRVELTGAQLREVLRIGTSGATSIVQVAGASVVFDPTSTRGADADGDGRVDPLERDRLCRVDVGGAPLEPARTYRVVMNDFMAAGGDHLHPPRGRVAEEGALLREVVGAWLGEAGAACVDPSAAVPAPEGTRVGSCP